jgi:hypothetical protein
MASRNCLYRSPMVKQQKQLSMGITEGCTRPRSMPCTAVGCFLLLLLLLVLPAVAAQENIVSNRIVGGTLITNPSKYPYFIEWEDAKCGASLIHDDSKLMPEANYEYLLVTTST